jgi:hypothetical protein
MAWLGCTPHTCALPLPHAPAPLAPHPWQERDSRMRSAPPPWLPQPPPRCHYFSSFFLNKLYRDSGEYNYQQVRRWTMPNRLKSSGQASANVLSVDCIVMPVHCGVHWTCAVVDLRGCRFLYYDSMSVRGGRAGAGMGWGRGGEGKGGGGEEGRGGRRRRWLKP